MDFPGGSDGKESACSVGDPSLIPALGRSPGEGNGNPCQYSCLENPMNWGTWQDTVHTLYKKQYKCEIGKHFGNKHGVLHWHKTLKSQGFPLWYGEGVIKFFLWRYWVGWVFWKEPWMAHEETGFCVSCFHSANCPWVSSSGSSAWCCDDLDKWEGDPRGRRYMHAYSWFTLLYCCNWHNIVKQLCVCVCVRAHMH